MVSSTDQFLVLFFSAENNVDGLLYTKAWLHRAGEIICKEAKDRMDSKPPSAAGSQASGKSVSDSNNKTSFSKSENATGHPDVREVVCPPGVSPAAILNTAYMELLDWNDSEVFPEVRSNQCFVSIVIYRSHACLFDCTAISCEYTHNL